MLADILRTDRQRLVSWQPDSDSLRAMRAQLSLIDDITASIVRGRNRLEAQLLRYFPQAVDIFSELTTHIALELLIAYPTPSMVEKLSYENFVRFCKANNYKQTHQIAKRFARLKRPTPFSDPVTESCFAPSTPILATRLLNDVKLKKQLVQKLQEQFSSHPDAAIYNSVPGAGQLLAPKLLSIFGDQPDRFPSPDMIRAIAGTCPATSQSGKSRGVFFRKACNTTWRSTFQQLAICSVPQSSWAATYFETARLRGQRKSHAYRCLANRWVGIIWTLQKRGHLYDESIHFQHLRQFKR